MDSNRQKKIGQLLQEELAEIFRQQSAQIKQGILISVTEVRVTPDLGVAKVYISIFPTQYREQLMKEIEVTKPQFRKLLGDRLAKQLRHIPELKFLSDTTLDLADDLEKELKGLNTPNL